MSQTTSQNRDKTLVILAAGMGSRYGGLKQLDAIGPGGEFVMDYSVHDALRAGFNSVVFVIRPDMESAFHESIGRRLEPHLSLHYVFQTLDNPPPPHPIPPGRTKPWGTAHAILVARDAVHTPFAVINADDFYGRRSFAALGNYLDIKPERAGDYGMVGFPLRNTLSRHGSVSRGVCRLGADDYLSSIEEHPKIQYDDTGSIVDLAAAGGKTFSGDEPVSMNMWGFQPDFFERLREAFLRFIEASASDQKAEFCIPHVVDSLIRGGQARVRVLATPDSWFGVTYSDDKPRVIESIRDLIRQGVYPEKLWTAS